MQKHHVEVIEEEQLSDNSNTPVREDERMELSDSHSGQKRRSLISISEEPSFRENDVSYSNDPVDMSSNERPNRWENNPREETKEVSSFSPLPSANLPIQSNLR